MPNFCSYCGSPLTDNATFCGNCGAPVTPDAAPQPKTDIDYIQLAKPIPPGMQIATDGAYKWIGETSVFKCMPFFRIMHIVSAVFAVLVFILIAAVEAGEPFGEVFIHCLIGVAVVAVVDLVVCLLFAAKRAFRFKAVFTIGRDSVSAAEVEAEGRNVFVLIVQLIAGLASNGDVQYHFSADYDKIRELVSNSSKTIIKVKAGGRGGFLLTTPEQHDFILHEIQIRMNGGRKI